MLSRCSQASCAAAFGTAPELMEPGKVYPLEIELGNISNCFLQGHRIRVDISSSFYPENDRNLNTPDRIGWGSRYVKAEQCIYHGGGHPSCMILPVMDGTGQ